MKKLDNRTKKLILRTLVVLVLVIAYFVITRALPGQNGQTAAPVQTSAAAQTQSATPKPPEQEPDDHSSAPFSIDSVPEYSGAMSVAVNGGVPYFTDDELGEARQKVYFEYYGDLDSLGRCTAAYDCLGRETMPGKGEKRGSISSIHPSGWHQRSYDCIDGGTIMTRTHLVGWMLSAENANEKNLITGTRYMNSDGMIEYEKMTQSYICDHKGAHVLYRVTPVYSGNELIARGVLMEGMSVEDGGKGLSFCAYVYNVQPGIKFSYDDGWSDYTGIFFDISAPSVVTDDIELDAFMMDRNTGMIHEPGCLDCEDGLGFVGDVSMVGKWNSLGYKTCGCLFEK